MADGWVSIGLGLGANLGDPATTIGAALRELDRRRHVRVGAVSSFYRTRPWGLVPQPDYANACALASTELAPRDLLAEVKAIELALGRAPGERWGPRVIDIDILFYADLEHAAEDLVIPHKSLVERAFVLVPLAEIAPDLVIAGRRIADLAATCDRASVAPWSVAPRD